MHARGARAVPPSQPEAGSAAAPGAGACAVGRGEVPIRTRAEADAQAQWVLKGPVSCRFAQSTALGWSARPRCTRGGPGSYGRGGGVPPAVHLRPRLQGWLLLVLHRSLGAARGLKGHSLLLTQPSLGPASADREGFWSRVPGPSPCIRLRRSPPRTQVAALRTRPKSPPPPRPPGRLLPTPRLEPPPPPGPSQPLRPAPWYPDRAPRNPLSPAGPAPGPPSEGPALDSKQTSPRSPRSGCAPLCPEEGGLRREGRRQTHRPRERCHQSVLAARAALDAENPSPVAARRFITREADRASGPRAPRCGTTGCAGLD